MPQVYDTPEYKSPDIKVANTIANLRQLAGPSNVDGALAFVIGSSAVFDGIAAIYVWDCANVTGDNGGTFIRPTAIAVASPGRWRRWGATVVIA